VNANYHAPKCIPNPQVLDAPEQYFNACVALEKLPPDSGVVLPLLHSAAISLELYLKYLAAEDVYILLEDSPVIGIHRVHAKAVSQNHNLVASYRRFQAIHGAN
jgi:hypothetical protein